MGRKAGRIVLLLLQACADALLAALVVAVIGGGLVVAWYVLVEGAPPLAPILAAWRDDAPIALSLFLPPALLMLAVPLACIIRFAGACVEALRGGVSLRWLPRLQLLFAGRGA